mmetsp:Transcript_49350/g.110996  ORF Transcript_49350/g.110996 Transcript_49350/m.110996 type:complete len:224 (-) Transcript_49350:355-1026(-)
MKEGCAGRNGYGGARGRDGEGATMALIAKTMASAGCLRIQSIALQPASLSLNLLDLILQLHRLCVTAVESGAASVERTSLNGLGVSRQCLLGIAYLIQRGGCPQATYLPPFETQTLLDFHHHLLRLPLLPRAPECSLLRRRCRRGRGHRRCSPRLSFRLCPLLPPRLRFCKPLRRPLLLGRLKRHADLRFLLCERFFPRSGSSQPCQPRLIQHVPGGHHVNER